MRHSASIWKVRRANSPVVSPDGSVRAA